MEIIDAIAIAPGKVLGRICLFSEERHNTIPKYSIKDSKIERELNRFEDAIKIASDELDVDANKVAKEIGLAEAEIIMAQKMILLDSTICNSIRKMIKEEKKNCEFCISSKYLEFEEKFSGLLNDYMKERTHDIADIKHRLLDILRDERPAFLCEGKSHCRRGHNRIVATTILTPKTIVNMEIKKVRGFITEHGGQSSHSAILARSLGIPAVSGVKDIGSRILCGSQILVDGDNGKVIIDPDAKTINEYYKQKKELEELSFVNSPIDGFKVMANAAMDMDIDQAIEYDAEGIGLYRTEFDFVKADKLLSEAEQFDIYSGIVKKIAGKKVVFRLLDVGGDKPLPFINIEKEENPYLGWRGARWLLGNQEILKSQVRALARAASVGPIGILIPMVSESFQLDALLKIINKEIDGVNTNKDNIQIGVMIEVPAAALDAERIFEKVDFCSVGTNDLIQYLFAIDRNNEKVSGDFDCKHPVLLDLLETLAKKAKKANIEISICGEMAAEPGLAKILYNIGYRSLSVVARTIPSVRKEISSLLKIETK